jgi:hypothetical protein
LRNRQSLVNWGIVLALLLGAGVMTIAWPAIFGNLGNSATQSISTGPETMVIPLPLTIAGRSELVMSSLQLMAVIAFLVIGAVITGGIVLAIVNWLLSRIIKNTQNDPQYQAEVATLEQENTQEIMEMRETRPTHSIPESTWSRWAVIATSLAILMFVAFFALLIADSLFSDGVVVWRDNLINITAVITVVLLAVTLVILFFAYRSRRRTSPDVSTDTDAYAIPWDAIAILLSGLLVVGIGIGMILLLNSPS